MWAAFIEPKSAPRKSVQKLGIWGFLPAVKRVASAVRLGGDEIHRAKGKSGQEHDNAK